jgi:4-hydroxybenzoate polyprenyltransferase
MTADAHGAMNVDGRRMAAVIRLLRPHQWVKNALVVLPLLLAHRLGDLDLWIAAVLAIVAFCLTASAIYVLNDLRDVDADRSHPSKRTRPFASGSLNTRYGPPLVGALLLMAAAPCLFLPLRFALCLLIYFGLSIGYSLFWKRLLLVDVMLLAGFYSLRIIAGGAAVAVDVSPWLLAFSIFLFLSLAFAKRYTELLDSGPLPGSRAIGRGYVIEDLPTIQSAGLSAGYGAVIVLALYINSSTTVNLYYPTPILLWTLCPLMLYWITRLWFLARRGILHHDPVLFALRDRVSWYVLLLAVAMVFAASFRLQFLGQ